MQSIYQIKIFGNSKNYCRINTDIILSIKIYLSLHTNVPYGILLLLPLPLKICSHAELLFYGLNVVRKTSVIRARNPATTPFRGQGCIWQKVFTILVSSMGEAIEGRSKDGTHSKIIALTSSVMRYHSGLNLKRVAWRILPSGTPKVVVSGFWKAILLGLHSIPLST